MILIIWFKRILRHVLLAPILFFALLLTKITDYSYASIMISLVPFKTGIILRNYFYRLTLQKCGKDLVVNFGTIISFKDTEIGDHVWLGVYNVFGKINIKDNVITAQGCHFSSGKNGHGIDRTDIPIINQEGHKITLQIGPDVWFGANCTTIANVGEGCVIGSGAVVVKDIPDWSIAVGNPCRVIKSRK